jgi:probable phosphoglycerate mutase
VTDDPSPGPADAPATTRRPALARVDATLALVRHGESTWIAEGRFQGRADPPLTDLGARQSEALAARLANPARRPALPLPASPPLAVWHSPLERAAATARAVAGARRDGVPLIPLDGLAELAQGAWEGLTQVEVRRRFAHELEAWRRDPTRHQAPGGESLRAAHRRAASAAGRIVGDLAAATVGAVVLEAAAEPVIGYERPRPLPRSEPLGGPWGIVVAHDGILRLMLVELLGLPLSRYWQFPFALAAVSVVELRTGIARLRAHNLDEHLAALA